MVESMKPSELQEILKPFYQRAAEAEDRLARLEAALASTNVEAALASIKGNVEHLKQIDDLQSKLEEANAGLVAEKEKAQKHAAENEKLQYRVIHLLRALKEANMKSEQVTSQKLLENIKLQDS